MKIGEAAKETGLSISNIRFYEKKGLLTPRRREESKYREYELEDVRRLKEIMLLRKVGLPVESIYLLYQGQAELNGLIMRQQEELQEQMQNLKGAMKLCQLLHEEKAIEEVDVEKWLTYVYEEEEKGQKFAQVEEFLEDLTEYSRLASFRYDPYVGRFFQNPWVARILAALAILSFVVAVISSSIEGKGYLGRTVIWFWGIFLLGYGMNFLYFRRWKRDKKEEQK